MHDLRFDDGATLVDLATGRAVAVNVTAHAVWLLAGDGTPIDAVVAMLAEHFAAPAERISPDVHRAIADLRAAGLLVPPDAAPVDPPATPTGCASDDPRGRPPEAHGDHWHLPLAASPCQHQVDALPWHGQVTVRVGRFHLGIRCDTAETVVVVRRLLAAHVVEDPAAPPTHSVVLGPPGPGGGFPRRGLYEGRTWLTDSEAIGEVVAALLARLDALSGPALRLSAVAVGTGTGGPGPVVLIPTPRGAPMPARAVWRAQGLAVWDPPLRLTLRSGASGDPLVGIDAQPGALTIDADLAARLGVPIRRAVPVAAVVGPGAATARAEQCAALVPLVHLGPDDDPRATMDRLAEAVGALAFHPPSTTDLAGQVGALLNPR